MRDPYVELGIAVVGRAIQDWRYESEAVAYITKGNPRLKKIAKFFNGELATTILEQINLDPKVLLEHLRDENTEKRIRLLSGGWTDVDEGHG